MSTSTPADASLCQRLRAISSTSLADASKATTPLRVLPRSLQPVRSGLKLAGRAVTAVADDDLMSVIAALALAGPGDVLVVAGGENGAVAGEIFATEALRRGVTGLVIDGFCRDRGTLAGLELPVYARGSVPWAPGARARPIVQVPVTIGTVTVQPGDLLMGDDDGIVVGSEAELVGVIKGAERIEAYESSLRAAIADGSPLLDHLNYDEHLAAVTAGRDSALRFA